MSDENEKPSKVNGNRNSDHMTQVSNLGLPALVSPSKPEVVQSQPQFRQSLELLRHLILQNTMSEQESFDGYSEYQEDPILNNHGSILDELPDDGNLELVLENSEESIGEEQNEALHTKTYSQNISENDASSLSRHNDTLSSLGIAASDLALSNHPNLLTRPSVQGEMNDTIKQKLLPEHKTHDRLLSPSLSTRSRHASIISNSLAGLGPKMMQPKWRHLEDSVSRGRFINLLDEINLQPNTLHARSDSIGLCKVTQSPIQPLQTDTPHGESSSRSSNNGLRTSRNHASPWNRIRNQNEDNRKKGKLFTTKNYLIPSTITEVSSNQVEQLNKEVMSYKIQLMVCKTFTHRLIEKCQAHGIDTENDEYFTQPKSDVHQKADSERDNLEVKYQVLQKNYDEVFKLNEDLYESIEIFEDQIKTMQPILTISTQVVHDILHTIIQDPNTDLELRNDLVKCIEDASISLEQKLKRIQTEIKRILDDDRMEDSNAEEKENQVRVTERLMKSIRSLQEEINSHKIERGLIEKELLKEVEELKLIKQNFKAILQKFSILCQSLNSNSVYDKDAILMLELDDDLVISEKLDLYKKDINKVRKENGLISNPSRYTQSADNDYSFENRSQYERIIDELNKELESAKKSCTSQVAEVEHLKTLLRQQQDELSTTIQSLTTQLRQSQHDVAQMRLRMKSFEQTKSELAIAKQKERNMSTDNARLKAKLSEHATDKERLQRMVDDLNERIQNEFISHGSSRGDEMPRKFEALVHQDMHMFSKLWKLFDCIADDELFKEPTRQLNAFRALVKKDQVNSMDVLQFHHYISEYFSRAVDILVKDHVKLLLEDHQKEFEEQTAQLHKRINELELQNDKLSGRYGDDGSQTDRDYNLIMNGELRKKFHREREQRIFENDQASKRVKDLEDENAELRNALRAAQKI